MVSSKNKKRKIGEMITHQDDGIMLKNENRSNKNIDNISVENPNSPQRKSKKNKKRKHEESEDLHKQTVVNDSEDLETNSDAISKKKKKKLSKLSSEENVLYSNEVEESVENWVSSHSGKQKKKKTGQPGNSGEEYGSTTELINSNDPQNEKSEKLTPIKRKKKNKQIASTEEVSKSSVAITENDSNELENDSIQNEKKKNRKRKKRKNSENNSEQKNVVSEIPPKKKAKKEIIEVNSNKHKQNTSRKISEVLPVERQRKTSEGSAREGVQQLNRNSEKSVVVEDLPIKSIFKYKTTLRKHFEKCGEIVYVGKVQLFPNEDKKLKFSTIIVFKELESVQKALEEDNLKFQDARIRVKTLPALVDSTIFVHSRSSLDQATLSTIFSPCGKINTILEVKHNTAFIQFADVESVPRALTSATEAKVSGNSIVASRYKPRPPTDSENENSVKVQAGKNKRSRNEGSIARETE